MRKQSLLLFVSFIVVGFLAGCSSTSDVIEEPQAQESTPEMAAAQEPVQPESNTEVELASVFYFDVDDATVRPSAVEVIKEHAERIKSSAQTVTIEGHADERGTDTYNQELGKRRADAVKDILISMGVNSNKIETVSYGEKNPLAFGSNEMSWQKNRRVELK